MMLVALEGMHFFAYHGYYEEERIVGNHFTVDVYIDVKKEEDEDEEDPTPDELLQTMVNYETVYLICRYIMRKPTHFIETIAEDIAGKVAEHFEIAQGIRVRVAKANPPLGDRVDRAFVEFSCGTLSNDDTKCE